MAEEAAELKYVVEWTSKKTNKKGKFSPMSLATANRWAFLCTKIRSEFTYEVIPYVEIKKQSRDTT